MFSARQGVEGNDINVFCLGICLIDPANAWEFVKFFLRVRFSGAECYRRRLTKVAALEFASDDFGMFAYHLFEYPACSFCIRSVGDPNVDLRGGP